MLEYLSGTVTETTMQRYRKSWDEYQDYCVGSEIDPLHPSSILSWRTTLVDMGYSPNTINSALSALKSIFRAACAAGQITIEVYTQMRAIGSVSMRALRDRLRPSNMPLTTTSVQAILAAIDTSTPKGLRDYAIVTVLATTGVRIEELSTLKLSDWNIADRVFYVKGKTDIRARAVPVADVAQQAISAWLWARDSGSAWLFNSFAGRSMQVQDKPITTQGAYNAVVAAAQAAGVNATPHDFRRYVATILANRNIVSAQAVLGHASIITTQRYVKRADLPAVDWLG